MRGMGLGVIGLSSLAAGGGFAAFGVSCLISSGALAIYRGPIRFAFIGRGFFSLGVLACGFSLSSGVFGYGGAFFQRAVDRGWRGL